MSILFYIIFLPLITIILLLNCVEKKNMQLIRGISLILASFTFLLSLYLLFFFDQLSNLFQYHFFLDNYFSYKLIFGIDGISIFFVLLVTFISLLCVLITFRRTFGIKFILIYIFLIEFFCLIIFTVLDIFIFYMFFESVLMPMFIMIGV